MSGVELTPAVLAQLDEAGRRGFLGPRAVRVQAEHARGFAAAWHAVAGEDVEPSSACDLGSGGGVPGLLLATGCWPGARWTLLDAMGKRCAFLEEAVEALELSDRVEIACGRAEQLGRDGMPLRGAHDLVTSRGFGAPGITAEAAAGFLQVGGLFVVSEPPDSDGSRWDPAGCAEVGLVLVEVVRAESASFAVLRQETAAPETHPRAWKKQQRQPLF